MSDTVALALITAGTVTVALLINRAAGMWAARNTERVESDDNPANDDAYDSLEEDIAGDTKPKT